MSEPILIPPGGGEIVGDSPERRVEILSDDETLHATWSRFDPRREGADLHVHHRHTDLFYVLEGELLVRLGVEDKALPVPPGTLARVPPLVVHGFRNGAVETRYLNFHAPGSGFADFMRALRDGRQLAYDQHPPPADGGRPITEAVIGGDATDVDEIAVAETSLEPGDAAPPPDVHRRHLQSFYVLEGVVTFTAGGRELHAPAGTWMQIRAGVPHSFAVEAPARFLDVHTPSFAAGTLDQEPA